MFISSFKSKSVLIILINNYATFICYDLNLSQFWTCWRTGNYVHKVQNFREAHKNLFNLPHALYIYLVNVQTICLLICTLISENQGLEKSRSVSNLRKISGPAHLDFFSVCQLDFFRFMV